MYEDLFHLNTQKKSFDDKKPFVLFLNEYWLTEQSSR